MKKWMLLAIYLIVAGLILLNRQSLLDWLQVESSWKADLLLFMFAFIVALVPAIPYGLIAALLGAKYGAITGSLINLSLSCVAAIALFLLVRYAFSPKQRKRAADMKGLSRITAITERSPFIAVLFARMLPVIPSQAINIFAALTRMNVIPYVVATIIGKIPFIAAATLLGDQIFGSFQWRETLIIIGIYGSFIFLVGLLYKRYSTRNATSK
ncbi:TVP38/TMEM64 family protein [Cohnella silvisoli]|uniref:TVP38/TMEM64 family membrane protein n=1 Tax=Cohnella silvisoli TaxID=2873699 RepID=A0ABV1L0X8_9BACL|nr:VTT domain-containing protein [Cohnella silvisoli]MCD9025261.1 VTT domain-containing protein [Cohnella silvisoli]